MLWNLEVRLMVSHSQKFLWENICRILTHVLFCLCVNRWKYSEHSLFRDVWDKDSLDESIWSSPVVFIPVTSCCYSGKIRLNFPVSVTSTLSQKCKSILLLLSVSHVLSFSLIALSGMFLLKTWLWLMFAADPQYQKIRHLRLWWRKMSSA